MKLYDISMTIQENMMVYKNKTEKIPVITNTSNFSNSSSYESNLMMNLHTGTHIDAPLHMIEKEQTTDHYPLSLFLSSCVVLDFTANQEKITRSDLEKQQIPKNHFVLLKTKNSWDDQFQSDFIYLDKSGAEFLEENNVLGVGIDALGIERNQPYHETHKILLSRHIPILEGLRLKEVPAGEYILHALPLKIAGVEAAPTRAVLITK